jgi:diaminopimelate epimerase
VAVAAAARGLVMPGPIVVQMEGGSLQVSVSGALDVVLRGPVEEVCEGRLTDAFLAGLARPEAAAPGAGP